MDYARSYMDAMVRHDLKGLPLAADVKATENAKVIQPGDGVSVDIKYFKYPRQYVADVKAGQIGVQGVLVDGAGEALFALRLKIENQQIKEIETLLTHDGQGGPAFEPDGFLLREAPYIDDIPAPERTLREDLLKAAHNYWMVATSTHDRSKVSFSFGCIHIENGMNTDWEHALVNPYFHTDEFTQQADGRYFLCGTDVQGTTPTWTDLRDYRAIADEERGLVMIWNMVKVKAAEPGAMPFTPDAGVAAEQVAKALQAGGFGPDDIPPGMSVRGMSGLGSAHVMYHCETERIIDGKIDRQQDFLRMLPVDTVSLWSH
jgi:hypothetical protein